MTEEIENARQSPDWKTQHLSGLGTTLETLMELQAILNQNVGYYAAFEGKQGSFSGRLELPVDKTTFLANRHKG